MKKLLFSVLVTASLGLSAQDYSVPAASPRQKIEQQFSLSKITVDYGRPAVKGRKIFGELVPFGKVWRAGANSSTKIAFGQPVTVAGKDVAAGTYGLYILPESEKSWKIILNKDSQSWGAYTFDEKLNVLEFSVPVVAVAKTEYFTITLTPKEDGNMNLNMAWDTSSVNLEIKPANLEKTTRMINQLMEVKKIEREK